MSTNSTTKKLFATALTVALVLSALRGFAFAAPVISPLGGPVLAGASLKVSGSGFSAGSIVNFFVSTANGRLNEGPFKPTAASSTQLSVNVPATISLGRGVVAIQVVNTDQANAASNLVYALLEGSAAAGIPTITSINGVGLAATSTNPRYAIDNVETVVPQGSEVTLRGAGFDTANGVAVDLFCACSSGNVGPFIVNHGDPALSATSVTIMLPLAGPNAQPVGPASFVVSNKGADGRYSKKSNAVSVPIGSRISVVSVSQNGAKLTVDGTGFSTLTGVNLYASQTGHSALTNLGGLTVAGASAIPVTLISDTELTFNVPAGALPGLAYLQAFNPPFVPFSTSNNRAFILLNLAATPTATVKATPTPAVKPTAKPTAIAPSPTKSLGATATATPAAKVAGVLLAGGIDNTVDASGNHPALASAEIYDEATGAFNPIGAMTTARAGHSVTMLSNSTILIAGGHNSFSQRPMPAAELYDVKTGSFSYTGSMNSARLGHAAVALSNGKVFVSGGINVDFSTINLAEIYDPISGQFTPTASLNDARTGHTATVLRDGTILVAGGANDSGILASAEVYDPAAAGNIAVGSMSTARQYATATLLSNGKVLFAGGAVDTAGCKGCATLTDELYNPATKTFTPAPSMHSKRLGHTATLLPNGRVLIAGGTDDTGAALDTAEIYDPVAGTFTVTGVMNVARFGHTAGMLASGKVLIAGGDAPSGATSSAEIYDPTTGRFTTTGHMTASRTDHGAACFEAVGARL